jgi:RNA polymerase sigma-70 factor (sigma-E family)
MPEAQTFEEFVATRSPTFLRLAYGLTRDHAHAEDLLQTALARTWPAWRRIEGDPEPYVRRVLVNTHNSWWRRRWNGERPTAELPETAAGHPQSNVDDRDEVWRALARLPKRQQAVLVLRFFEDLSEAQIAETLGMAPGTVKSYAAKGLAQLRRDPSLLAIPRAPQEAGRLDAVKQRIKRRSRVRAMTVTAVIAAIIAILIGSSAVIQSLSLEPEPAGPGGFPLHLDGDRVVAGQRATFDQTEDATFVWTPSTLTPHLYFKCDHQAPGTWVNVGVEINGVRFHGIACDDKRPFATASRVNLDEDALGRAGVQLGQPAEVTVTFLAVVGTLPDKGFVAVGIGEPVARDRYPFPKRPRRLPDLDRKAAEAIGGTVLQAGGAQTVQLDARAGYSFRAQAQSPGLLRIRMDGRGITTFEWWDYRATVQEWAMPAATPYGGEEATTLTVVAEHMTGDWILVVKRTD